jgi:hypothetical protein
MARGNPLEPIRQCDRQVRADDDTAADTIARKFRKRLGHEWRGFADSNDAEASSVQARRNRGISEGVLN